MHHTTPTRAWAADTSQTVAMIKETGCKSKYSDEKKADIYAAKYKDQRLTALGKVSYITKEKVGITLDKSTMTYDVLIKMADPKGLYDLEKDTIITVEFTVDGHGGCFLPFSGKDGVIVNDVKRP
jgi:hypothetical protein